MTKTKTCECGAEFKRSRTDRTVRCPACRAKTRRTKTEVISAASIKALEAKSAAYRARSAHGVASEEYREALAEFTYWRDRA